MDNLFDSGPKGQQVSDSLGAIKFINSGNEILNGITTHW